VVTTSAPTLAVPHDTSGHVEIQPEGGVPAVLRDRPEGPRNDDFGRLAGLSPSQLGVTKAVTATRREGPLRRPGSGSRPDRLHRVDKRGPDAGSPAIRRRPPPPARGFAAGPRDESEERHRAGDPCRRRELHGSGVQNHQRRTRNTSVAAIMTGAPNRRYAVAPGTRWYWKSHRSQPWARVPVRSKRIHGDRGS